MGRDGRAHTPAVTGLSLFRREGPGEPTGAPYGPSVCLAPRGAGRVPPGDDPLVSDPHHCLMTSVHMPAGSSQPAPDFRRAPYLRSSTSRTLVANWGSEKGFCRKFTPSPSTPCWEMASAV